MVEIPEHLLKRSKERRAAMGLGGGDADPDTASSPSSDAPAAAAPAAAPAPRKAPPPEPKAPEPPRPDPLYIQAAKQRSKLPWWSIPVFAALPIWGWVFVNTLTPVEAESDPFSEGEALYGQCAGCHMADGTGAGSAPALDEVVEHFPDFRDQAMWVSQGSDGWLGDTYGTHEAELVGGMPGFGQFTDEELAQVVLHERVTFGGLELDPDGEDVIEGLTDAEGEPLTEQHLYLIADGELTFADVGLGELSAEAGFSEDDL